MKFTISGRPSSNSARRFTGFPSSRNSVTSGIMYCASERRTAESLLDECCACAAGDSATSRSSADAVPAINATPSRPADNRHRLPVNEFICLSPNRRQPILLSLPRLSMSGTWVKHPIRQTRDSGAGATFPALKSLGADAPPLKIGPQLDLIVEAAAVLGQ